MPSKLFKFAFPELRPGERFVSLDTSKVTEHDMVILQASLEALPSYGGKFKSYKDGEKFVIEFVGNPQDSFKILNEEVGAEKKPQSSQIISFATSVNKKQRTSHERNTPPPVNQDTRDSLLKRINELEERLKQQQEENEKLVTHQLGLQYKMMVDVQAKGDILQQNNEAQMALEQLKSKLAFKDQALLDWQKVNQSLHVQIVEGSVLLQKKDGVITSLQRASQIYLKENCDLKKSLKDLQQQKASTNELEDLQQETALTNEHDSISPISLFRKRPYDIGQEIEKEKEKEKEVEKEIVEEKNNGYLFKMDESQFIFIPCSHYNNIKGNKNKITLDEEKIFILSLESKVQASQKKVSLVTKPFLLKDKMIYHFRQKSFEPLIVQEKEVASIKIYPFLNTLIEENGMIANFLLQNKEGLFLCSTKRRYDKQKYNSHWGRYAEKEREFSGYINRQEHGINLASLLGNAKNISVDAMKAQAPSDGRFNCNR